MKMLSNRKIAICVISIIGITVVFLLSGGYLHKIIRRHILIHEGQQIVEQLDAYKSKTGHLPKELEEVNTNVTEIYYKLHGDSNYILWFGEELGESVTYHSDEHAWR